MKRTLAPILHRVWYTRQVEDQVTAYFREAIFGPLLDMVADAGFEPDPVDQGPASRIKHARPTPLSLADALRQGKLWYKDGAFFSDTMSANLAGQLRKLGAKRDPSTGAFMLAVDKLPVELREPIAQSAHRAEALTKRVLDTLQVMEANVAIAPTGLQFGKVIERITHDLEQQFIKTCSNTVDGLEGITVKPSFTPESRAAVTRDFTEAIDLPIKNFSLEQILELRQLVEKNALAGNRSDKLAQIIEARFGVAKRKAVFLASQETSLFTSAYREHKYRDIGSTHYKWSTSHDERVRHSHAILNNRIFAWDDPPLIQGTNRHCNPGSDFGCRCVPLPIISIENVASILPP